MEKYQDIIALIIKEYEGSLTAEEFRTLEDCLAGDSQLLDFYVQCYLTLSCFDKAYDLSDCFELPEEHLINIEGPLWTELSNLERMAPSFELPKPLAEKVVIEKLDIKKSPRRIKKSSVLTAILSSAALIFFLILIRFVPAPPTRTPIGRVIQVSNAEFPRDVMALSEGRDCFAGSLRLDAGSVLLEMDTGTQIFLTAPIEIDLHNTGHVHLNRGKLLARVPPRGLGFTVSSPQGSVVVYGTEFTVSVDFSRQTQVEVFTGRVDLRSSSNPLAEAASYLLAAGQIGRVDASGAITVERKLAPAVPVRRSLERVWAGTDERATWRDPANWDHQEMPDPYSPAFLQGRPSPSICLIDETHIGQHRARAEYINIGLWGYGHLEMTGGELETEEIWVGRRDGGQGVFTISGGTIRITEKRDGIIIGKSWEKKAGHGEMNFRGGTILFDDPRDNVILGWGYPAQGVLNIEGGQLSLPNQLILGAVSDEVQSPVPLLGTGHVNIKAGVLRAGSLLIRQGRVDIQQGVLVLKGDVREALQEHIQKNLLTAYDGAGALLVHYDAAADETLIQAEP